MCPVNQKVFFSLGAQIVFSSHISSFLLSLVLFYSLQSIRFYLCVIGRVQNAFELTIHSYSLSISRGSSMMKYDCVYVRTKILTHFRNLHRKLIPGLRRL